MQSKRSINQNIRDIRQMKRLSVKETAGFLDMTSNAYIFIENGKTKVHFEHLNKLAELFEMSPLEIISWPNRVILQVPESEAKNYKFEKEHPPGVMETEGNKNNNQLEKIIEEQRRIIDDLRWLLEKRG